MCQRSIYPIIDPVDHIIPYISIEDSYLVNDLKIYGFVKFETFFVISHTSSIKIILISKNRSIDTETHKMTWN